jgi:hypothetical protein
LKPLSTRISNLKQIDLVKKQDNLLSKLLILRSRVSTLEKIIYIISLDNFLLKVLIPPCRGLRSFAGSAVIIVPAARFFLIFCYILIMIDFIFKQFVYKEMKGNKLLKADDEIRICELLIRYRYLEHK